MILVQIPGAREQERAELLLATRGTREIRQRDGYRVLGNVRNSRHTNIISNFITVSPIVKSKVLAQG